MPLAPRLILPLGWLLVAACGGKDESTTDTGVADTDTDTDADADTDTDTDGDTDTDADADTDTDSDTDTDTTSTTLSVTFAIDPDVAADLDEPAPAGPFVGQVFRAEDVGPLGPEDGAVALGDISVAVDLPTDGSATGVLFQISPVAAGSIAILGFVDTDGNADASAPEPDRGDPVTLPGQNTFEVVAGQDNVVEVWFGLLNPL